MTTDDARKILLKAFADHHADLPNDMRALLGRLILPPKKPWWKRWRL